MDDAGRELIRRCREGSDAAFRQLIEQYESLVFALIRRAGGDSAPSAQLAQDVFIQIHRGLPYFRGQASVPIWIYRIVSSVCAQSREGTAGASAPGGTIDEHRLIEEASRDRVDVPARFADDVMKRRRREWLAGEERIDWWFNATLTGAGVVVILAVLFAVQRSGVAGIFTDVFTYLASALAIAPRN